MLKTFIFLCTVSSRHSRLREVLDIEVGRADYLLATSCALALRLIVSHRESCRATILSTVIAARGLASRRWSNTSLIEDFTIHINDSLARGFDRLELDKSVASRLKTGSDGDFGRLNFSKRRELLVQVHVGPSFRAVLHKDCTLRVSIADVVFSRSRRLRHRPNKTTVHVIGQCTAHLTLYDWKAELLQSFLGMLQLLELDECKVEIFEKRPSQE